MIPGFCDFMNSEILAFFFLVYIFIYQQILIKNYMNTNFTLCDAPNKKSLSKVNNASAYA